MMIHLLMMDIRLKEKEKKMQNQQQWFIMFFSEALFQLYYFPSLIIILFNNRHHQIQITHVRSLEMIPGNDCKVSFSSFSEFSKPKKIYTYSCHCILHSINVPNRFVLLLLVRSKNHNPSQIFLLLNASFCLGQYRWFESWVRCCFPSVCCCYGDVWSSIWSTNDRLFLTVLNSLRGTLKNKDIESQVHCFKYTWKQCVFKIPILINMLGHLDSL